MNEWPAILAFVIGFTTAQLWKFIEAIVRRKKHPEMKHWRSAIGYMMRSGGMPSGHTASMVGTTVYLGATTGWNSAVFMLAIAVTIIVLYDATHVRKAVGEMGERLNELLPKEKRLEVVEGHTVAQVAVGAVIGVIVGTVVYLWLG